MCGLEGGVLTNAHLKPKLPELSVSTPTSFPLSDVIDTLPTISITNAPDRRVYSPVLWPWSRSKIHWHNGHYESSSSQNSRLKVHSSLSAPTLRLHNIILLRSKNIESIFETWMAHEEGRGAIWSDSTEFFSSIWNWKHYFITIFHHFLPTESKHLPFMLFSNNICKLKRKRG